MAAFQTVGRQSNSGILREPGKHRQRGAVRNGIHDTSNAPPQPRSGEELAKAMIAGAELKKQLAPSWKTTKGVFDSQGEEGEKAKSPFFAFSPLLLLLGPFTIKESHYRLSGWSYQCACRKLLRAGGSGSGSDGTQAALLKNFYTNPFHWRSN